MILTLPDLIDAANLRTVRALLHNAPWQDGRESAGAQARRVKNNQQLPHDCAAAEHIRTLVLERLQQQALFFSAALPKRIFTPRVNRYSGAHNAYGAHVDGAIRMLPDGQRVRTDLSCTVFLSDPADYDGGELCIADTFGTHAIKLPAGHAVLYPGSSVHEVRPVTRGERMAVFFWVESMVRRDDHRRLLFEMDMALTALRTRHGESAETTALAGSYHNLLRLWADT
ncbi:PKHD-type hydroxylase [Tibeticola sediminis]|uniref:PKHD-type hydroxylase n=1 Tax=Tibeticola sediminis TaxID=1917811 RepID=A0A3N4UQ18_9BURK|nr:Fe2+-dependent dioxygenase [Tibeticola sediminis]RPE72756.1 PKHD-type hydroxylase [Tibeticola sediminis]